MIRGKVHIRASTEVEAVDELISAYGLPLLVKIRAEGHEHPRIEVIEQLSRGSSERRTALFLFPL